MYGICKAQPIAAMLHHVFKPAFGNFSLTAALNVAVHFHE